MKLLLAAILFCLPSTPNPYQNPWPVTVMVSVRAAADDAMETHGSGVVIESTATTARILTAAQLMHRGSKKIRVTRFRSDPGGPGMPPIPVGTHEAELVAQDAELDIAIIRIQVASPIPTARLAPVGYKPAVRTSVRVVGLHGPKMGGSTRVTTVHSLCFATRGWAGFQVDGLIRMGYSGGAAFTADGLVIGTAMGKDEAEQKGVYSSHESSLKVIKRGCE